MGAGLAATVCGGVRGMVAKRSWWLLVWSDLPVDGVTERCRIPLQRGQANIEVASLQTGHGRLGRAHPSGDLSLAQAMLPAGGGKLVHQLPAAIEHPLQAREGRTPLRR